MARKKKEDFDVVTASQTDDGTVVITSLNELSEERMNNVIRNAVASYDPENKQYSTYLKISASSETLTVDRIDELARGLQSSLTNVQTVNGIIRNYINKDDLIGITYLSLIHISEPTRRTPISYAVFCLKKKTTKHTHKKTKTK